MHTMYINLAGVPSASRKNIMSVSRAITRALKNTIPILEPELDSEPFKMPYSALQPDPLKQDF